MFKHLVAIVALSLAIVMFMTHAQQVIDNLLAAHDWVAKALSAVFSNEKPGDTAKNLIALLAIPFVIGLIPSIFYWLLRKSWFPYFMNIVWIVWLVQVGALIMVLKTTTTG